MAELVMAPTLKETIFILDEKYYQKLGEVWDHETKDFKILYKPLYSCPSKNGSFEAHHLATSTFERWHRKFIPLTSLENHSLPDSLRDYLLDQASLGSLTRGNPSLPATTKPLSKFVRHGSVIGIVTVPSLISSPPPHESYRLCQTVSGYGSRSLVPYHVIHFDLRWKEAILSGTKKATTRVLSSKITGSEATDLHRLLRDYSESEREQSESLIVEAVCDLPTTPSPSSSPAPSLPSPVVVFAILKIDRIVEYPVRDLPLDLALAEGFLDLSSFVSCLREYYPFLQEDDAVHVFHFHLHQTPLVV
jgi:hypothetical protein